MFGFSKHEKELRNELDVVKKVEEELHDAIENAASATDLAKRTNITTIELADMQTPAYKEELAGIWESKVFQTELFLAKQLIFSRLITEKPGHAVELQCMLKGIDLLVLNITTAGMESSRKNEYESRKKMAPEGIEEDLS